MKKPVTEYTLEEIEKRLAFADRLLGELKKHGRPAILPPHLEEERQGLIAERNARQRGVHGEGI